MGSKTKVKEFLEASETHQHYNSIVDFTLTFFIAKAEKEGNPIAEELKKVKAAYQDEFAGAIEITEEVYAEIFNDEELQDLIVLHTTPAIKKLRGLTSDIMNRILKKYALRASS